MSVKPLLSPPRFDDDDDDDDVVRSARTTNTMARYDSASDKNNNNNTSDGAAVAVAVAPPSSSKRHCGEAEGVSSGEASTRAERDGSGAGAGAGAGAGTGNPFASASAASRISSLCIVSDGGDVDESHRGYDASPPPPAPRPLHRSPAHALSSGAVPADASAAAAGRFSGGNDSIRPSRSIDDFFEHAYRSAGSSPSPFQRGGGGGGMIGNIVGGNNGARGEEGGGYDSPYLYNHRGVGSRMSYYVMMLSMGIANSSDAAEILCVSYMLGDASFVHSILHGDVAGRGGLVASTVFLGMLLGGWAVGVASDTYGRKPTLLFGLALNSIAGASSAMAPSVAWLAALRFVAGLGIGATVPPLFTLVTELSPPSLRGRYVAIVASFWMVGSVYVALVALWTFEVVGWNWRAFAALCALPSALGTCCVYMYVPHSPRFLAGVWGRYSYAADVSNDIARAMGARLVERNMEYASQGFVVGGGGGGGNAAGAGSGSGAGGGRMTEDEANVAGLVVPLEAEEVRRMYLRAPSPLMRCAGSDGGKVGVADSSPTSYHSAPDRIPDPNEYSVECHRRRCPNRRQRPRPPAPWETTTTTTTETSTRLTTAATFASIIASILRDAWHNSSRSVATLYSPSLRTRTTLPLQTIWFALSFGSYGLLTWINSIFAVVRLEDVYFNALLFALANLPGNVLSAYSVEWIGRRWTLTCAMSLSAVSLVSFAHYARRAEDETAAAASALGGKETSASSLATTTAGIVWSACAFQAFSIAGWNALDALTGETFPTSVRGSGMGLCTASGRIGALLAQVVNGMLVQEPAVLLLVAGGMLMIGALAPSWCLGGDDLRGRALEDDVMDELSLSRAREEEENDNDDDDGGGASDKFELNERQIVV